MILLAFLFPVAIYLLVLGHLNRRRTPVRVSGVWDFVGLLGAASGFLLLGGPAVLSSLSDRWRQFWMTGQPPGHGGDPGWPLWVFLSVAYFVVVVLGAAFVFWHQRHLTAIYNVEPTGVERALAQVCERLGLTPVRSGNLFLFGMPVHRLTPRTGPNPEGIQAPHYRPGPRRRAVTDRVETSSGTRELPEGLSSDLDGETAVLEVYPFASMWHATLRWDPAVSNLRHEVEAELDRVLAESPVPEHELGAWLTLSGLFLLAVGLLGVLLLIVYHSTPR